jgi:hypothetical protein
MMKFSTMQRELLIWHIINMDMRWTKIHFQSHYNRADKK